MAACAHRIREFGPSNVGLGGMLRHGFPSRPDHLVELVVHSVFLFTTIEGVGAPPEMYPQSRQRCPSPGRDTLELLPSASRPTSRHVSSYRCFPRTHRTQVLSRLRSGWSLPSATYLESIVQTLRDSQSSAARNRPSTRGQAASRQLCLQLAKNILARFQQRLPRRHSGDRRDHADGPAQWRFLRFPSSLPPRPPEPLQESARVARETGTESGK